MSRCLPQIPTRQIGILIRLGLIQVVAVTAEWLVDSIDGLASTGSISKEFIGVILLPIVGNAAGELRPCARGLMLRIPQPGF